MIDDSFFWFDDNKKYRLVSWKHTVRYIVTKDRVK